MLQSSGGIRLLAQELRRYQISGKWRYKVVAKLRRYQISGKQRYKLVAKLRRHQIGGTGAQEVSD